MKHITKILALVLALIMVLGLATTAFAANTAVDGPFTVIVNNADGHEYVIYQIFTGELAKDENGQEILSNIKYGENYGVKDTVVPEDVLATVKANPNSIVPTGKGQAMTTADGKATIEGLEAGYYMIKDMTEDEDLPDGEATSAVIFQVVGDTEITSKHPKTTIVKKVQDINDSTGAYTTPEGSTDTWIDSADYDIGDTVPFKSTANFEGLENYTTYKVVFTDTMAKGLDYQGDMKVSIGETDVTGSFDITTTVYEGTDAAYADGTVITVTCNDITALTDENAVEIVLMYTAKLDTDANIGAAGNPNKIKVTTKPDGTGETPEDVNIVFTYKVEANKYANQAIEGNELKGAGFTLSKWYANEELEGGGEWKVIGEEIVGATTHQFAWNGIDDGKYKLEETTTPAGFNTIDPIEFEVEAGHIIVHDNPSLTDLTGETETGEIEFSADASSGIVSTDVVNKSGTILPETGGIGTTLFYIAGGLLAMAAVVLLVTKKRMASAE